MSYKSFDLLKKLYFVRTSGTEEEKHASEIIKKECEDLGVEAVLESFKVNGCKIKEASLKFFNPDIEVDCVGVGMSGSTSGEGITGEFVYVDSLSTCELLDIEGKICLVHSKLVGYSLYEKLAEKKAAALILCTGDVYEEKENVDIDPYMYRERHYSHGKIPAVCIRMKDAEMILKENPKSCHIVMIEEEFENDSYNVVATIEGDKFKNEVVAFTAHYDSVSYSKGAYDNATGSCAIMQLLAYFKENKPQRTLKFIWCGSEEVGLLGSKAYTVAHEEELKNYKLCINVDMIGAIIGTDMAHCTSNISLANYIRYLGAELGFSIGTKQSVYSSDSTSFADKGVPAVTFARLAPGGGAKIHSRKDVLERLDEVNYYRTCDFMSEFSKRLINSYYFPVEREMPDNIRKDLDTYLGKKK